MIQPSLRFGLPSLRQPALNLRALVFLVACLALAGSLLVARFAAVQEERDIAHWQNKLSLIADSRAAALTQWLEGYNKELGATAADPSLQLYLTDYLSAAPGAEGEEPMQIVFLRNLLLSTANRLGLLEKRPEEMNAIKASLPAPTGTGLALLAPDGKVIVSTAGLAAPSVFLKEKIAGAPEKDPSFIDMFLSEDGAPRIGFVFPVFPIQADQAVTQPLARLVAIKNVGESFFSLLRHPGLTEDGLATDLLRQEGDTALYLSPYKDQGPMKAKLSLAAPRLDAAFALSDTDLFAARKDESGNDVLMTSRAIAKTPWVLLVRIARDKAMAESDLWRRQTETILYLALLSLVGGIAAAWYYGTSKRSYLLSLETGRLAAQLAAQERLLRVVADNQLEPILIVDSAGIVCFANEKAANVFRIFSGDVVGKDLPALMGPARAQAYETANKNVLETHSPVVRTWRETAGGSTKVVQSVHIPLRHVPLEKLPVPSPGVLIIDQDVSGAVSESERHVSSQRQLINALVNMVDERDHHAAHHSMGVSLVARAVAEEMRLVPALIETAETAGRLMNIGKILVPSEILTKPVSLGEEELRLVRESLKRSADFLEGISFDGPVVETLRQMQERFDGQGPLGLKGEEILTTARIIAVANAFVGMVSPRAYRTPLDMDEAVKSLLREIDTRYDKSAVVALAHFVENKKGRDAVAALIRG